MKIHKVYSTPSGELFLKCMSKENNAQQFYLFKTNRKTNLNAKQGRCILSLPYKIILHFHHHNHIIVIIIIIIIIINIIIIIIINKILTYLHKTTLLVCSTVHFCYCQELIKINDKNNLCYIAIKM